MTVKYKNDFKIRIPSGFSAQIVFDMLGEKEFIRFYKRYQEVKKSRSEQRKLKSTPTLGQETESKIKDVFRKDPKFYGKVIDKIIIKTNN